MFKIGENISFKYDGRKLEGIPCFYVHKIDGFVCVFDNCLMVDVKKIELVSKFDTSYHHFDHFYVNLHFVEIAKAFRLDSYQALPDGQNQLLVIKYLPNDTIFEATFVSAFFDSRQGVFLNSECNPIDIVENIVVPTGEKKSFILSDRGMKALEKIYPSDI